MATLRSLLATVCASLALVGISFLLHGCGGDDQTPQSDAAPAYVSPIALTLGWNPSTDSSVMGYVIHYGMSSPNSPGSCNYENSVYVNGPEGTIINLHPETRYYVAVSAYNGADSACSAEVSTVTAPLPTPQETPTSTT